MLSDSTKMPFDKVSFSLMIPTKKMGNGEILRSSTPSSMVWSITDMLMDCLIDERKSSG